MTTIVAGVEFGGTKCICVLASDNGEIFEQVALPTEAPNVTLPAMEAILDRWMADTGFRALGIGAFGPVDLDPVSPTYGDILATPKPHWSGTPLYSRFCARYPVPVGIESDVSGAALAEGRWGAAHGRSHYVYITVGTGVGAGIVVDGRLLSGPMPIEAGHMRVARMAGDTWQGACPFHGDCVEGLASGPAIEARTGVRASTLKPDDPVWDYVVQAVTAMVHNLTLAVAPQLIMIGGGVMMRQPQLLARVGDGLVASLADYLAPTNVRAILQQPTLGDAAGPLGAVAIALEALMASKQAGG